MTEEQQRAIRLVRLRRWAENCVTHHDACDCRELRHAEAMEIVRAVAHGWPNDWADRHAVDIYIEALRKEARALLAGEQKGGDVS